MPIGSAFCTDRAGGWCGSPGTRSTVKAPVHGSTGCAASRRCRADRSGRVEMQARLRAAHRATHTGQLEVRADQRCRTYKWYRRMGSAVPCSNKGVPGTRRFDIRVSADHSGARTPPLHELWQRGVPRRRMGLASAESLICLPMRYLDRENAVNPSRLGMRTAASVWAFIVSFCPTMPLSDRM